MYFSTMKILLLAFISLALEAKQLCPGGTFQCDDDSTCCQLLNKQYGCCPMIDAVCCADHIHCCPGGTACVDGTCVSNSSKPIVAHLVGGGNTTCPGGQFVCPEDTTCCKGTTSKDWGCCPLEDAVCCSDGFHCCPANTKCDLEAEKCIGDRFITEIYRKKSPTSVRSRILPVSKILKSRKLTSVVCPGGTFQCPDKSTCCITPIGSWGCCPFENGVCCDDKLHCCPQNMFCDATSQYCSQGMNNITSVHSKVAKRMVDNLCPDSSTCSENQTCCKITEDSYGCCNYQNATCCGDFEHCCPENYTCDVEGRRCIHPFQDREINLIDNYIHV